MDPNVKGIPDFWYTIFRNVSMLCEMMQEHDEPILKCLQDIKGKQCQELDRLNKNTMSKIS